MSFLNGDIYSEAIDCFLEIIKYYLVNLVNSSNSEHMIRLNLWSF